MNACRVGELERLNVNNVDWWDGGGGALEGWREREKKGCVKEEERRAMGVLVGRQ